jgi:CII-binding regulator of phage lambda lysogenization HflD
MRNYMSVAVILLIGLTLTAQTDAIESYFQDYQQSEDFKVVYVGPKMFQMFAKTAQNGEADKEFGDIVRDLKGLRILSSEKKPLTIYSEANKRLNSRGYEELMTLKEKGSQVRFITKESNGVIEELLLVVASAEKFTMMSFTGKIDLNKISRLAKKLDIEGAEHLEKVNKK